VNFVHLMFISHPDRGVYVFRDRFSSLFSSIAVFFMVFVQCGFNK
jgi:hypothetical protein